MSRSTISHEQARRLAARRLDEELSSSDLAALSAHFDDCLACSATAAGYEADRLALRALPPIEPPRDLWARTSVALEREHLHGPATARRLPRRWGPVAGLASGLAVVLVLVIVGTGPFGGAPQRPIAQATPRVVASAGRQPVVTPIAVDSQVSWVVTKGPDLSLVTANVTSVCPTGDEPGCPPIAGVSKGLASLPTAASAVTLSPTNGSEAIAAAPSVDQAGTTLYVLDVKPAPAGSPGTSPASSTAVPASSQPAISPTPAASQPAAPSASPSARTKASPSVTPLPSASGEASPPASPSIAPPASGSPAPSAAATLAIVSNVTLVGDEAAYSPDGQWFAFSARPAASTTGPDIYVWRPGQPAAVAITSDHGTVFSGWVDGQILASRAIPTDSSGSPSASPSASSSPAASPSARPSSATPKPSSSPAAGPSGPAAPGPSASASAALFGALASRAMATPAAFLIQPATGQATRLTGLDGWRPVVDPSGRWVAYWAGSLAFDPASLQWQPAQGRLEVASWPAVKAAPDPSSVTASARVLPFDDVADWDVSWDEAGSHLGVWIADTNNPGLGSLSLLTIDGASGAVSSVTPQLLSATLAERGFTLKDGQLVWASPPGQDGNGSHLSVLAWSGPNAGKTTIQSLGPGVVLLLH